MFISTSYFFCYFMLAAFIVILLSSKSEYNSTCEKEFLDYFEISVAFYILAIIISAFAIVRIRKEGLTHE